MSNSHRETKSIRIFRKIRFTHLHDIYDCTKSALSLHTEATISSEFEVKSPAHLFSVFLCRLSGHFLRHFRLLRPDEHNICYDRTGSLWYLRELKHVFWASDHLCVCRIRLLLNDSFSWAWCAYIKYIHLTDGRRILVMLTAARSIASSEMLKVRSKCTSRQYQDFTRLLYIISCQNS